MERKKAEILLSKHFGITSFYDTQWDVIQKLQNNERVLLIEKTGYGKSLCFQFPALFLKGVTIVFSPLIALMRDQVKKLNELGIPADCINSEQSLEENNLIIEKAVRGEIKILYIAPERQENEDWFAAAIKMNISMLVIDEAHCISVWGHDFRPAFRRIINLVNLMPKGLPILATTATATKRVENDVIAQIGGGISVIRGQLLRENLRLFVINAKNDDEKMIWLGQNLEKITGSGIIYTGTRVDTEIFSKWLQFLNISSVNYNAGLDSDSRKKIENGFMNNEFKCVVSTNALGMGIDKPDIRFIIHTHITQSPIHYYQEIGRAGRDGQPSYIILFYCPADIDLPLSFIETGRPDISRYSEVIQAIKNEMLSERELLNKLNLKTNQLRVIKADLIEQGIIREVIYDRRKKLEYIPKAPALNINNFEELRKQKYYELNKIIEYAETKQPRMKFLCEFLDDGSITTYKNCDNTSFKKRTIKVDNEWLNKIEKFHGNYFPVLEVENRYSNLKNGYAASFYGVSNVGTAIHRSKYENGGDFPEFLLNAVIKAFKAKLENEKFDLIVYVPPTKSGNLVKNFAEKISRALKIPISHNLQKSRITNEQKIFVNNYLKSQNVKDAFSFVKLNEITGKSILLIDDIFDSGATIRELGRFLTIMGTEKIVPLVIAKTVGGDSL